MANGDQPKYPMRTIYGLTVDCDIDLIELREAEPLADPDIVIREGNVPQVWEIDKPDFLRAYLDGEPGHLWTRIPDTIRMSIRDGRSITYAIEPESRQDEARLFLMGSGMGAILMQRGHVVVHGNAITLPNRNTAIVCIGDSGAGKSTTAIAMMQRGYSILADDICPIDAAGMISPGMPRAKLWDETAANLAIETAGLRQVRDGDAKFNLPLGQRHCSEPRRIYTFVWLVPDDVNEVSCTEVTGVEKFAVLRNNVYRHEYLLPLGLESEYLTRVAQIAAQTKVFKVVRPKAGFDIDPLLDTISLLYDSAESAADARAQP